MNVSIYMKGDYEEFHALKAAKKQSQFGCFTAENADGAEVFDV